MSLESKGPTLAGRGAYLLRHLLAVLALPVTVTLVVPVWIARRGDLTPGWPNSTLEMLVTLAGIPALTVGLTLFGASLHQFFSHGRGTLAPWDPPRRLVVRGPYRYVRNPMISGVMFVLCGTALLLRSQPHAIWALIFVLINAIYIPLLEEPDLEARFGTEYLHYKKHVRRFIPRLTAWTP